MAALGLLGDPGAASAGNRHRAGDLAISQALSRKVARLALALGERADAGDS